MPGKVAVVTDSTAYLPEQLLHQYAISVVPVSVVIGGSVRDETHVKPDDIAAALREWTPVTTSRPAPQRFADTYQALADSGHDAIVSLHLSSELSATGESAAIAAANAPVPVTVVDSRTIGMALGYAVITAAQVAASGADAESVATAAQRRLDETTILFYVDTLEYLRRGGRIGKAGALVGSALSVKPLLHVVDGRVETLEKVRTKARALARLQDIAVEAAASSEASEVDVAVHHLSNEDAAHELADSLQERIPNAQEVMLLEIGAVVGAHVGPGTIAAVVAPRVGGRSEDRETGTIVP